jgi:hypothetical protein
MEKFNMKSTGIFFLMALITCCFVVIIFSQKYLGPNNAVEEKAEDVLEEAVEDELGVPAKT